MGRIIIVLVLLGLILAGAGLGLWFGKWMWFLTSNHSSAMKIGCFVVAPIVGAATAVQVLVVPLVGFFSGIIRRGK
jgi:hypothetical protein